MQTGREHSVKRVERLRTLSQEECMCVLVRNRKKKRRQRGGETLRCPISALSKSACATSAADIKEETELTRGRDLAVLTAVLLVRVVSAVVLAVAPPVVRNAVVILAAEFMRSAGLFIFFHQEQTSKQRDENGFKGHEY